MEVCISRIEGIQRLLGETSVAKDCPATPVVHGTLHLGMGGRQPVRILLWRSVRCVPCTGLRFRAGRWSLAGGGAIGNLSGYSPARSLRPEDSTNVNIPWRSKTPGKKRGYAIPLLWHLSPDYVPFCPTGPWGPPPASCSGVGFPPRESPLQSTVAVRTTKPVKTEPLLRG